MVYMRVYVVYMSLSCVDVVMYTYADMCMCMHGIDMNMYAYICVCVWYTCGV